MRGQNRFLTAETLFIHRGSHRVKIFVHWVPIKSDIFDFLIFDQKWSMDTDGSKTEI